MSAPAADRLAQAVLEVLETQSPRSFTKPQLVDMRLKVIDLCSGQLAAKPPRVKVNRDGDPEYLHAMRLVAGYEGEHEFMLSLQESLSIYGSLTPKQAAAVLAPPRPKEAEMLRGLGVSATYFWQINEALEMAKAADLAALRDELAEHR